MTHRQASFLSVVMQAGRVWRDGQKKRVYVYRLLATGTIEEKVRPPLHGMMTRPCAQSYPTRVVVELQ